MSDLAWLFLLCPRCQGGLGDVCWSCMDEEKEQKKIGDNHE